MTARASVATVLIVAAAISCRGPAGDPLEVAPPPEGWEESLREERASRDESMRGDPDGPIPPSELAAFAGLEYWPPNPDLRFRGAINRYESPERLTIITTTGRERPCERYGWIRFRAGGRHHTLQVYRLLDAPGAGVRQFFLPFTDLTNGVETYPAGRYVNLDGPEDGPYVVDFNYAYNPLCAYGRPEKYVCPVPPRENALSVRIEAGERGWHRTGAGR